MRVAGYIREVPGADNGESSYAQSERIRRWVVRGGHALVAICQDVPQPGYPLDRAGYRALLGIVEAGEADVVLVPDLEVLSPDKIVQEIMIWNLRSRGVSVLVAEEAQLGQLIDPPPDAARLLIRDVLARVSEHQPVPGPRARAPEVVVELWEEAS